MLTWKNLRTKYEFQERHIQPECGEKILIEGEVRKGHPKGRCLVVRCGSLTTEIWIWILVLSYFGYMNLGKFLKRYIFFVFIFSSVYIKLIWKGNVLSTHWSFNKCQLFLRHTHDLCPIEQSSITLVLAQNLFLKLKFHLFKEMLTLFLYCPKVGSMKLIIFTDEYRRDIVKMFPCP